MEIIPTSTVPLSPVRPILTVGWCPVPLDGWGRSRPFGGGLQDFQDRPELTGRAVYLNRVTEEHLNASE